MNGNMTKASAKIMVVAVMVLLYRTTDSWLDLLKATALVTSTAVATMLIIAVILERLYKEDGEQ